MYIAVANLSTIPYLSYRNEMNFKLRRDFEIK